MRKRIWMAIAVLAAFMFVGASQRLEAEVVTQENVSRIKRYFVLEDEMVQKHDLVIMGEVEIDEGLSGLTQSSTIYAGGNYLFFPDIEEWKVVFFRGQDAIGPGADAFFQICDVREGWDFEEVLRQTDLVNCGPEEYAGYLRK